MINEKVRDGAVVERETLDLAGNLYRLERDSGAGLVVVTQRVLTQAERDMLTATANLHTVESRVRDALAANKTFLAIATPTNSQTLAQVRALTRQVSALIRMKLDDFRDIE
jgi:hypothetical protein